MSFGRSPSRSQISLFQTMAKVICALLRYTDDEKSLIIEHEKLRQTVITLIFLMTIILPFVSRLALVEYIKIIFLKKSFYCNSLLKGRGHFESLSVTHTRKKSEIFQFLKLLLLFFFLVFDYSSSQYKVIFISLSNVHDKKKRNH